MGNHGKEPVGKRVSFHSPSMSSFPSFFHFLLPSFFSSFSVLLYTLMELWKVEVSVATDWILHVLSSRNIQQFGWSWTPGSCRVVRSPQAARPCGSHLFAALWAGANYTLRAENGGTNTFLTVWLCERYSLGWFLALLTMMIVMPAAGGCLLTYACGPAS